MKYLVNFYQKLHTAEAVNAQSKARVDVTRTITSLDIKEIAITKVYYPIPFYGRNFPYISAFLEKQHVKKNLQKINKGDLVIFQDYKKGNNELFIKEAKKKGALLQYIVHDIPSIRFNREGADYDIEMLNVADLLYVHTDAMKNLLIEWGVTAPMEVMNLFDYYSADSMMDSRNTAESHTEIVFAGNLGKSEFLPQFLKMKFCRSIKIRLYGLLGNLTINNPQFEYCGVFNPDNTGAIKGGWGLVWDGKSTHTCDGPLGEYLKYNSSHKMSLYAACGLPLIVWSQSSLAGWIVDNKIGITINNLSELEDKINAISEKNYWEYLNNIRNIGDNLRNGNFLKTRIQV